MTDEMFDEWYAAEEAKSYNARQPRDDHGRWSDGAGGISQGHAAHVMKFEGISDAAAAGVLSKIKDGTHKTREDVLKHIDSIHAAGKGAAVSVFEPNSPDAKREASIRKHAATLPPAPMLTRHIQNDAKIVTDHLASKAKEFDSPESFLEHLTGKESHSETSFWHHLEMGNKLNPAFDEPDGGMRAREANVAWTAKVMPNAVTKEANSRLDTRHSKNMDYVAFWNKYSGKAHKSLDDIEYSNDDETEAIMDNTLISFGGEIKSVEETETGYKFGGWLVVFDKPDVSGLRDRFTKSTDFDIEDGDRRSLYYNHGLDGTIKKEKLGDCHVSIKDAGVWISGELKKRSDYLAKHVQHIAENIKQFGLSSGAPAHLVERVKVDGGHEIKKWILSEASVTPTPAEPFAACMSLKSLVEMEGDADLLEDEYSNDDETKHLTALEFGQIGQGSRFVDHLSRALAANGEFHERIADLVSDRASNRKSGRVLSADKHAQISEYRDGLQTIVESLSALLEEHNPNAESKSLDDEIEELEIGWMQQQLKLNDLLRKV